MTMTEKRKISRYLRDYYSDSDPKNVRFADDGAVTVHVDPMPNTDQAGRIFAGWDTELLAQA